MAPKSTTSSRKRSAPPAESHENNTGSVEDAPKSKKSKPTASNPKNLPTSTSDLNRNRQTDHEGADYWELSRTKRVQISEFKGMTMVNLREFYEKDGEWLPGKKGIGLTVEQFVRLVEVLPGIEGGLKRRGVSVPRPEYTALIEEEEGMAEKEEKEEDQEEEAQEEEAREDGKEDEADLEPKSKKAQKKEGRLEKFKLEKSNHEATSSDED